jgi:hypothetical protein
MHIGVALFSLQSQRMQVPPPFPYTCATPRLTTRGWSKAFPFLVAFS